MTDFIKEGDYVILQLPSDNKKIVKLSNQVINLGKFGKFDSKELIGKTYGRYEISESGVVPCDFSIDNFNVDLSNQTGTNVNIHDNSLQQKLSQSEIEEMKLQLDGNQIIQNLVDNNGNYSEKTEFSKAKYIKRKLRKFAKAFTIVKCNARSLCEYYESKDYIKIREIRIDTLSQMMSLGNVRAGSRVLCVDDTGGLLGCAIMERMGGLGDLVFFHDGPNPALDMLKFCGHEMDKIKHFSWTRIDQELVMRELSDDKERDERLVTRYEKLKAENELLHAGDFDTLLIASKFDPLQILEKLSPFLMPSSQVVIYSPVKELLLPAFQATRRSKNYLHILMTESWLREYQVPVFGFGTHPLMTQRGNGGFLLSCTTCFDDGVVIEKLPFKELKKRKESSD